MISDSFYCAILWTVVLFLGMNGYSLSTSNLAKDDFAPKNCSSHAQCQELCFKGEFLYSRCDSNGTCVCDCSNQDEVPTSYTSACEGKQPEGHWREYCDKYCTQEYLRPSRYCNDSSGNFYCTCVCTKTKSGTKLVYT